MFHGISGISLYYCEFHGTCPFSLETSTRWNHSGCSTSTFQSNFKLISWIYILVFVSSVSQGGLNSGWEQPVLRNTGPVRLCIFNFILTHSYDTYGSGHKICMPTDMRGCLRSDVMITLWEYNKSQICSCKVYTKCYYMNVDHSIYVVYHCLQKPMYIFITTLHSQLFHPLCTCKQSPEVLHAKHPISVPADCGDCELRNVITFLFL